MYEIICDSIYTYLWSFETTAVMVTFTRKYTFIGMQQMLYDSLCTCQHCLCTNAYKAAAIQGLTIFVTLCITVAPSAVPYILPTNLQTHSSLTPNQLAKTLSDFW